jgi:hypothetical protein
VTAWLFPTSLTAVVPMVAALRTPTVRLRYLAARELLRPSTYERLLELLGCATVDRDVVAGHLERLTDAFDRAAADEPSPEISPVARPVAIGGSRELVQRGDHREAVFWIVATWARCGLPAELGQARRAFRSRRPAPVLNIRVHGGPPMRPEQQAWTRTTSSRESSRRWSGRLDGHRPGAALRPGTHR